MTTPVNPAVFLAVRGTYQLRALAAMRELHNQTPGSDGGACTGRPQASVWKQPTGRVSEW